MTQNSAKDQNAQPPDLRAIRSAFRTGDPAAFLEAVRGRDIHDVLQQVARAIPKALEDDRAAAEPIAESVISGLQARRGPGDQELAENLEAAVRGETPRGDPVPVDLEDLAIILHGSHPESTGGYLDLKTGEVIDGVLTDPMWADEDAAVDVEEEPDRWRWVQALGSHDKWQDMSDFGERYGDTALGERLSRAIHGRGAFRRFRDVIGEEGLVEAWRGFAADRELGRAWEFLADNGIRPTYRSPDP